MAWDTGIMLFGVFCSIVFTFFVVDATYLNALFIQHLLKLDTHWPEGAQKEFQRTHIDPKELTEYLDIRFIAMRTDVVGKVIYYPFVIFFLIVVSRISLFDNWDWPLSLLIILIANVSLALLSAILLRRSAEEARKVALTKLRERQLACLNDGNSPRGCLWATRSRGPRGARGSIFNSLTVPMACGDSSSLERDRSLGDPAIPGTNLRGRTVARASCPAMAGPDVHIADVFGFLSRPSNSLQNCSARKRRPRYHVRALMGYSPR